MSGAPFIALCCQNIQLFLKVSLCCRCLVDSEYSAKQKHDVMLFSQNLFSKIFLRVRKKPSLLPPLRKNALFVTSTWRLQVPDDITFVACLRSLGHICHMFSRDEFHLTHITMKKWDWWPLKEISLAENVTGTWTCDLLISRLQARLYRVLGIPPTDPCLSLLVSPFVKGTAKWQLTGEQDHQT